MRVVHRRGDRLSEQFCRNVQMNQALGDRPAPRLRTPVEWGGGQIVTRYSGGVAVLAEVRLNLGELAREPSHCLRASLRRGDSHVTRLRELTSGSVSRLSRERLPGHKAEAPIR